MSLEPFVQAGNIEGILPSSFPLISLSTLSGDDDNSGSIPLTGLRTFTSGGLLAELPALFYTCAHFILYISLSVISPQVIFHGSS